jgi:hypothetical protein
VNLIQAAGTDNDLVAVRRIANVLAKRRHVDPETVMPKLLSLFDERAIEKEKSSSLPTGLGTSRGTIRPVPNNVDSSIVSFSEVLTTPTLQVCRSHRHQRPSTVATHPEFCERTRRPRSRHLGSWRSSDHNCMSTHPTDLAVDSRLKLETTRMLPSVHL